MSSDTSSPRASPEPTKKTSHKKRKADQPELEVDLTLPEPPSKKAKRALKKGKPLPPKKDSDDEREGSKDDAHAAAAAATDKTEDGKPAKKERSPFGVWIGNLRFTVTRDELRRWLIDNSGGSITEEMITRVHIPSSKSKGKRAGAEGDGGSSGSGGGKTTQEFENKGFAYVDFATYPATIAAIALSETEWYRRKLLIKDATNFEGRPEEHKNKKANGTDGKDADGAEKAKEESTVSKSRKIFVGNLGFQTTEDDVKGLFTPCGEIEWVKVATFEDSGKCKGYGWVKFAEGSAADSAVKGFVKIKEVEETEEDFMDEDDKEETEEEGEGEEEQKKEAEDEEDSSSASEQDDSEKKPNKSAKPSKPAPEKKVKMRKWWVNTLHGRRLKIEHAEDDQTRYKKRYGKDANRQKQNESGKLHRENQQSQSRHSNQRGRSSREGGSHEGADKKAVARKEPTEASNFHTDINVARLTGAAVKPEGKKITFE